MRGVGRKWREGRGGGQGGGLVGTLSLAGLCASRPGSPMHTSVRAPQPCPWPTWAAEGTLQCGPCPTSLPCVLGALLPSPLSHPCLGLELDSGVLWWGPSPDVRLHPSQGACPWRFPEQASVAGGVTWARVWAKLPANKGSWARLGAGRPDPAWHRPLHLPVPTTPHRGATCSRGWEPQHPRPPAPGMGLGTDGRACEAYKAHVIAVCGEGVGGRAGRHPGPQISPPTHDRVA